MRALLLPLLCLVLTIGTFVWSTPASPQESEGVLNRLLAPGPLSKAHHGLEDSCLKCHDAGKGISVPKCLECHKPIKMEIDQKRGFHGLTTQTCIECHKEHKGRNFDTTRFETTNFNHASTGFKLEGKHSEIKCQECHMNKRSDKVIRPGEISFLGARASCMVCHKKDDPHSFKGKWANKECSQCHASMASWKEQLRFDHDRDTRHKLEGSHRDLKCSSCHFTDKARKNSRYQWPKLEQEKCLSCHKDNHKTNLSPKFRGGTRCLECHNQDDWKIDDFDHSITRYVLRGKHAKIKCEDCHKQTPQVLRSGQKNFKWAGLKPVCLACHKDYHVFGGARSKVFGSLERCLTCHDQNSWKKTHDFDHDVQTQFRIEGKHEQVKCEDCHVFTKGAKQVAKEPGKLMQLRLTPPRFPAGKSKVGIYHFATLGAKTCETCHVSSHKKSFRKEFQTKKCSECHTTEGWRVFGKAGERFDHNTTRFPLTGSHKDQKCDACHDVNHKQVFKFTHVQQKFCVDCHRTPHADQFEPKFVNQGCFECHSTVKFNDLLPFDHNKTRFQLKDKHLDVKCLDCHTPTEKMFTDIKNPHAKSKFQFPDLNKKGCVTCHSDYHKGQLGTKCQECHSERSWKKPQFNHEKQSRFALKGKHAQVKCQQCHQPEKDQTVIFAGVSRPLIHFKPINTDCATCHADYHKGQLGNKCQQCHMEKSWKEVSFDHNESHFPLKGKHEQVQCQKCHKPVPGETVQFGNATKPLIRFKPIGTNCATCHQDPHNGQFGSRCVACHSEAGWKATPEFHKNFTLSGVHNTLGCIECHKNNRHLAGMSTQCFVCHQKDDIHHGQLPNCKQCHRQEFWENTSFHHSMTRFPLYGAHRTLECNYCHSRGVFQGLPLSCVGCHANQALGHPPHDASIAGYTDCNRCHNQFSFIVR